MVTTTRNQNARHNGRKAVSHYHCAGPLCPQPGLNRLAAFFQSLVERISCRIELLEAVLDERAQRKIIVFQEMNAARRAMGKQPAALIQIQRYQVPPWFLIYRGYVAIVAKADTASQTGCAGRCINKRYLRNFLARGKYWRCWNYHCRIGDQAGEFFYFVCAQLKQIRRVQCPIREAYHVIPDSGQPPQAR
jgi:hypothetical protein